MFDGHFSGQSRTHAGTLSHQAVLFSALCMLCGARRTTGESSSYNVINPYSIMIPICCKPRINAMAVFIVPGASGSAGPAIFFR